MFVCLFFSVVLGIAQGPASARPFHHRDAPPPHTHTLFSVSSQMAPPLVLSPHDQSSWTDLTFLLKPAIRPDPFLPPGLYFWTVPWHLLSEWPQKQFSLESSLMLTARPVRPRTQKGTVSVFSRAGRGIEASRPQEESFPTTTHRFLVSPYPKLHTPMASPPSPDLQLVSKSLLKGVSEDQHGPLNTNSGEWRLMEEMLV